MGKYVSIPTQKTISVTEINNETMVRHVNFHVTNILNLQDLITYKTMMFKHSLYSCTNCMVPAVFYVLKTPPQTIVTNDQG